MRFMMQNDLKTSSPGDLFVSSFIVDQSGEMLLLRGSDNSCGIFVSSDTHTEFCQFTLPPNEQGRDEAKRLILALVDWLQIIKTENGINEQ